MTVHLSQPTIAQTVEHTKTFGGILGMIAVIYASAATVGVNLPTPAWSSDISALERQIDGLALDALQIAYREASRQLRIDMRDLQSAEGNYRLALEEDIAEAEFELDIMRRRLEEHAEHGDVVRLPR